MIKQACDNPGGQQAENLVEGDGFSSGTMRIGSDAQPSLAERQRFEIALLERLRSAETDDERVRLLGDLGSYGNAESIAIVGDLLECASPLVRMQAVKSLRLIMDERADALILKTLHNDCEIAVRTSAAFAAGFRRLDAVIPSLQQSAARDTEPLVRLAALDILGPAARTKPEIVSALEWLAKNDPDQRVRDRSARFLRKLGS